MFSRDLLELEIKYVAIILDSLRDVQISNDVPDRYNWSLEPLGVFSSKSFFEFLCHDPRLVKSFPVKKGWNGLSPPHVQVFLDCSLM